MNIPEGETAIPKRSTRPFGESTLPIVSWTQHRLGDTRFPHGEMTIPTPGRADRDARTPPNVEGRRSTRGDAAIPERDLHIPHRETGFPEVRARVRGPRGTLTLMQTVVVQTEYAR